MATSPRRPPRPRTTTTSTRSSGLDSAPRDAPSATRKPTAGEYVRSGRATIRGGRIHLPNGDLVPNDGTGRGLQAGVDSWIAGPSTSTSVTSQGLVIPVRDLPGHASLTTTASRIEEIAYLSAFQVAGVSSSEFLITESDTDTDIFDLDANSPVPDILRVFAAEMKRGHN